MNCPLCNSTSKIAFEAKTIPVRDCNGCDHRFAEIAANEEFVANVYDDSYFYGGGAGYSDYAADSQMLVERGRMYADKISKYTTTGKVLDVGAAGGFILKGFVERGWDGIGIEPNHSMARLAGKTTDVNVVQGTLEQYEGTDTFDLVSMIQVIGHFYDLNAAFRKTRDLLNEGGMLLVEGWNRDSISARVFGKHWHEYSPPSVLHWFSLNSLRQLLDAAGFDLITKGRPSKRISGSHAKSLLRYRLGDTRFLNVIPDRLRIPYPSEDLFWALFKKR